MKIKQIKVRTTQSQSTNQSTDHNERGHRKLYGQVLFADTPVHEEDNDDVADEGDDFAFDDVME